MSTIETITESIQIQPVTKLKKLAYTGVIVGIGPSDLVPAIEIATIALFGSINTKTGDVIQTYHLPTKTHPIDAVKNGQDESVCGDCPLKPSNSGICYVRLGHGPSSVYRTFKNGRYPHIKDLSKTEQKAVIERFKNAKKLRLGAWGEPSSDIKSSLFLARLAGMNTLSYTHQWRTNPQLRPFTMASVDNQQDYLEAKQAGWRTYRHTANLSDDKNQVQIERFENEIVCPHVTKKVQCNQCGLCNGTQAKTQRDIVATTI
tara:strand:+ start:2690 stop:3469 length:780 start_codon:yes stop_codon:yes gene_type:complete